MKALIKRLLPAPLLRAALPAYHFLLALTGAVIYRFPSRRLIVIGVTGTKGKTSTTEILSNILEAGGATTAVLGTLRFKIGDDSKRNLKKMTMPGRFFVQKFLHDAVRAHCSYAVVEMTSEGAKQFRQRFIDMDALIFTNLSPEHIESHGSYEAYRDAKLAIARTLAHSSKPTRFMVANNDDKEGALFLTQKGVTPVPYSQTDVEIIRADDTGIELMWRGKKVSSPLPGIFNAYNIIAAITCAEKLNIPADAIVLGIERTRQIEGRMQRVDNNRK